MSSHLLSTRLKRLEEDGIIERRLYQTRPRRYEYRLTPKGKDLHGIVLALRTWGLRWRGLNPADQPAVKLIHTNCGGEVGSASVCRDCGEPLHPRNITATFSHAFAAEREARRVSFTVGKPAT